MWKERKQAASDLRAIYTAATLDEAELQLEALEERWGEKYPAVVRSWRANWERLTTLFDLAPEIQK